MLAYTSVSTLQIYLPAGDKNTSLLMLTVYIRDTLNCMTKYEMQPIIVAPIREEINTLIDMLDNPTYDTIMYPIFRLEGGKDQNTVAQVITSLSFQLNQISEQNLKIAIASEYDRL